MNCCPTCGARLGIQKRVIDYLRGRAGADGSRVIATTSYEIGQRLGIQVTSVCKALNSLEKRGVITWERGRKGGGRGRIALCSEKRRRLVAPVTQTITGMDA